MDVHLRHCYILKCKICDTNHKITCSLKNHKNIKHENIITCGGSQEAAAERRQSRAPIVRTPRKRRSWSLIVDSGCWGGPPNSAKGFLAKWLSVKGVGGGACPLNGKNPLKRFWQVPLLGSTLFKQERTWLLCPLCCARLFCMIRIAVPDLSLPCLGQARRTEKCLSP